MSLVFIGDIHQDWHHVQAGLSETGDPATGDGAVRRHQVRAAVRDELAAPLLGRGVAVYWIHGNHDYDTGPEMWASLARTRAESGDGSGGALHGRVVEIDGVRVAGLGGAFLPRSGGATGTPGAASARTALRRYRGERPGLEEPHAAALAHFLAGTRRSGRRISRRWLGAKSRNAGGARSAGSSHPGRRQGAGRSGPGDGRAADRARHHHVTSQVPADDGLRALSVGDTWAVGLDGGVVWRGEPRSRPLPRPAPAGWFSPSPREPAKDSAKWGRSPPHSMRDCLDLPASWCADRVRRPRRSPPPCIRRRR